MLRSVGSGRKPWAVPHPPAPVRLRHAVSALAAPRSARVSPGPAVAASPRGASRSGLAAPSGHALSSGGVARLGFLARRGCGVVSGPAAQPGAQADAGCAFGLRG
jgi:hypothetical protein